ncbi:hypothetical protein [Methylocystis sp. S23]|jgi:hypothetical protein
MIRLPALLTFLLAGVALADGPAPSGAASHADQRPVPAFGDDHPDCAEWTDGCVVCARGADGADCSMAGVACLPAEPACVRRRP